MTVVRRSKIKEKNNILLLVYPPAPHPTAHLEIQLYTRNKEKKNSQDCEYQSFLLQSSADEFVVFLKDDDGQILFFFFSFSFVCMVSEIGKYFQSIILFNKKTYTCRNKGGGVF